MAFIYFTYDNQYNLFMKLHPNIICTVGKHTMKIH